MRKFLQIIAVAFLLLYAAQPYAQAQGQVPEKKEPSQQQEKKASPAQPTTQTPTQPAPAKPPVMSPNPVYEQSAPTPQESQQKRREAEPTKEELDKIAAAAASSGQTVKPPDPAQSFYPGTGVDLNIDFLNFGWSDQFEMGLGGIHVGLCRFKRLTYCGIGTVLMINASGQDPEDGSEGTRFVVVSPLTFSAEKHIGVTIYPYWDPSRKKNKFGVAGGFSLVWKQWGGKLRPQKEKGEITVTTFESKPNTESSKPADGSLTDEEVKKAAEEFVARRWEANPPEAKKRSVWVRIFTLGLVR